MKFNINKFLELSYIFNSKQPSNIDEIINITPNKTVTFLNPFSIFAANDNLDIYSDFDFICSDGLLPILLNKIFLDKKLIRISFDFTSLAPKLFTYSIENNLSLFFLGSDDNNLNNFIHKIKNNFPDLNIKGYHHGFIQHNEDEVLTSIINKKPSIIIIGLGTPYQDIISIKLRRLGFLGSIFTCGGFFSQIGSSDNIDYYPKLVNKLNLRWLYRFIKEPHTRKRYMIYYPKFVLYYSIFLALRKFKTYHY